MEKPQGEVHWKIRKMHAMEDFDFMNHLENVRPAPTWKSRRESTGGSDPISIRCYHILAGAATYLFSFAILSGAILAGAIFQVLPYPFRCYHIHACAATYFHVRYFQSGATTYLQVLPHTYFHVLYFHVLYF